VRHLLDVVRGDEPFYFLNELVDLFLAAARGPWSLMESIADQLETMDITARDVATAMDDDPATEFNALLLQGPSQFPASLVDQYEVDAAELRFIGQMPASLGRSLDGNGQVDVAPLDQVQDWSSHRLRHTLQRRWLVRPTRPERWLITSTAMGWRVRSADDDRMLTTDDLCCWLDSSESAGDVFAVCEVDDFAVHPVKPSASRVRHLPYPFDHYLTVNSDIDFANEPQVERTIERISDELGLSIGGSYYLDAVRTHAVSAATGPVERWSGQGAMDTLHAWLDTIDVEQGNIALDPDDVRHKVEDLASRGLSPLLFTTHGGGHAVKEYGNLHTGKAEPSAHDMDRPDSPFYLMPALRRLGVRFVSPVGHASTPKLAPIDKLVETLELADGDPIGVFRRLLSRRHVELGFPERWRDDKNASNAAALGFQVSDITQRLKWSQVGHGGILYTHLNHIPGDQTIDRLGWTEETHRAFELLAWRFHGGSDDRYPGERVWVAPAAVIVAYANTAQRATDVVEVAGDMVSIGSWDDDRLDMRAPAYSTHGTTLLHGLTVYVDDATKARVEVEGHQIDTFVRNPCDATGRQSITIVDDSAPRAVLLGGNVVCQSPQTQWMIAPIPLRGMTHVAFTVELDEGNAQVGFADERGVWHEVSVSQPGRHVVPLPMFGMLAGVRISGARLHDVVLLRPRGCVRERGDTCVLGGRVRCDGPLDFSSWRVVVGDSQITIDDDGSYAVRDLPRGARLRCHLQIDGRNFVSLRGREALMTCDQWDWDYEVRSADLLE
jgi:hypothetical protein